MPKIKPIDFGDVVADVLKDYSDSVKKAQTSAFDEIAEGALKAVTDAAREQSGRVDSGHDWSDYIGAFDIDKTSTYKDGVKRTVYVKAPHHRLTHLLENGHALRNGGRSRKFPHFKSGQEYLDKEAEKILRSKLEVVK